MGREVNSDTPKSHPDAVFIFGGRASENYLLNVIVDGKTVSYEITRVQLLGALSDGLSALKAREAGLP